MVNKVWFIPASKEEGHERVGQKVLTLFREAGLDGLVSPDDLVALKLHFGERDNIGYVKPEYLKPLIDAVYEMKGKPFFVDTNTLYRGRRANSVDHLLQAYDHGFTFENTGAPVIIADGILSKNYSEIPVGGKHFDRVKIANDILHSDVLIGVAHVTGHVASGLGAAIKNLGMGCASRSGKQNQHADVHPRVDREKCTGCGTCVKWCPVEAIEMVDGAARIDQEKCYGCAECIVNCRFGAIAVSFAGTSQALQEKMAEYALGVAKSKSGKCGFMNFLMHVTKNCDCTGDAEEAVVADIGIVASTDPVALDQATVDLLNRATGKDLLHALWPASDYSYQLAHAESIGLGTRHYDLIRLDG